MANPETIRERGLSEADAEVLADTLNEYEDEIRCSGECGECPHDKINTCFN